MTDEIDPAQFYPNRKLEDNIADCQMMLNEAYQLSIEPKSIHDLKIVLKRLQQVQIKLQLIRGDIRGNDR